VYQKLNACPADAARQAFLFAFFGAMSPLQGAYAQAAWQLKFRTNAL
jgi:hypothetical protein